MGNIEPRLEHLQAIWVDGSPIAFQAAALLRSDELGPNRNWQMLIARPAIEIDGEDFAVRVTTRDGITYSSRAKVKFANLHPRPGIAPSVVLEGTRPLGVRHRA
jgi:hypothetical protein